MIRQILAVIIAYAIFAVSAVLFFNLSRHPPHNDAPLAFQITTALYGAFFSLLAGYLLQLIAHTKTLRLNFILAILMLMLAEVSILTSKGSNWTQLLTMLLFAPASILGGYIKVKK